MPIPSGLVTQMSYTPRKIFLGVGVHEAQTLEEVATLENPYGFDEVHAFDSSHKNMHDIKQRVEGFHIYITTILALPTLLLTT